MWGSDFNQLVLELQYIEYINITQTCDYLNIINMRYAFKEEYVRHYYFNSKLVKVISVVVIF